MYAGVSRRFIAGIIDSILIVFFNISILAILLILMREIAPFIMHAYVVDDTIRRLAMALGIFTFLMIAWVYFAYFESSIRRGTIGKILMGIEVVSIDYKKISIGQASLRYWSKYLSIAILMLGYIMPVFTKRKQALHDYIAGTYVMNDTWDILGRRK